MTLFTIKSYLLLALLFIDCFTSQSQVASQQSWNDFVLNYSFANSFNFENTITYNTKLNSPRWREYAYNPVVRWSIWQYTDITIGATASYVQQTDTYNTFELRPALGGTFLFTPNRRIQTLAFLGFEQRNFQDLETKSWETSVRTRTRAAMVIPINRKSYFDDKQWYGMVDAEWFWVTDEDVNERYANRLRLRTGIGYRWDYRWRFELIYLQQHSKNNIGEEFYTSDNILWIRIRHFIARETKPKPEDEGLSPYK